MSLRHRDHPELDIAPAARPCQAPKNGGICGHNVSQFRWDLGFRTCHRCDELGKKSARAEAAAQISTRTNRVSEEKEAKIEQLIREGYSCTEIEAMAHTSRNTVLRISYEYGLTVVNKHGKSRPLRVKRSKSKAAHAAAAKPRRQTSTSSSTG